MARYLLIIFIGFTLCASTTSCVPSSKSSFSSHQKKPGGKKGTKKACLGGDWARRR